MPITWTKEWEGVDDGTVIRAVHLKNIQEDMAGVLTTSDIGTNADMIVYEGEIITYDGDVVFA